MRRPFTWDSASTALPVIAALLGAGDAEILMNTIKQRRAGIYFQGVRLLVDYQRYRNGPWYVRCSFHRLPSRLCFMRRRGSQRIGRQQRLFRLPRIRSSCAIHHFWLA